MALLHVVVSKHLRRRRAPQDFGRSYIGGVPPQGAAGRRKAPQGAAGRRRIFEDPPANVNLNVQSLKSTSHLVRSMSPDNPIESPSLITVLH